MQFISIDSLNNHKWYFADGWYFQKSGDVIMSKLSAKNFPDPFDVWARKIDGAKKAIGRELTIPERDNLKPRQYIFDIWEHRNAYINDKLQPE